MTTYRYTAEDAAQHRRYARELAEAKAAWEDARAARDADPYNQRLIQRLGFASAQLRHAEEAAARWPAAPEAGK